MIRPIYSWKRLASALANRWLTFGFYWPPPRRKTRHHTSVRKRRSLTLPETADIRGHWYEAILGLSDNVHCFSAYGPPTWTLTYSRQSSNASIYERQLKHLTPTPKKKTETCRPVSCGHESTPEGVSSLAASQAQTKCLAQCGFYDRSTTVSIFKDDSSPLCSG